jgi:putative transcriptional regulator
MVIIHLAELLAKKRWKPKYLSELTGIRYNTVLDLYNDVSTAIKFDHLEKICTVLECSMTDLIEIVPNKK